MKTVRPSCLALLLATATLMWTGAGETSDPMLSAKELPLDIVGECYAREGCQVEREYAIHWLNKTAGGELFLAVGACPDSEPCGAWLVEKRNNKTSMLLEINGEYRLIRSTHAYPDVEVRRTLSENEVSYDAFSWQRMGADAGRYLRTASRHAYQIDGVECGSAAECRDSALSAARNRDMGEALKILEAIEPQSWI